MCLIGNYRKIIVFICIIFITFIFKNENVLLLIIILLCITIIINYIDLLANVLSHRKRYLSVFIFLL